MSSNIFGAEGEKGMNDKIVVIYGAGASYASGYKINIVTQYSDSYEKPLMDKNFFGNNNIKILLEEEFWALCQFIKWYFPNRNNIGLEELWTAVDLNYRHITLDTYNWRDENEDFKTNLITTKENRYEFRDLEEYIPLGVEGGRMFTTTQPSYNECKFLGDCLRNLKELIWDIFTIFNVEREKNQYLKLHEKLEFKGLLGYITFKALPGLLYTKFSHLSHLQ